VPERPLYAMTLGLRQILISLLLCLITMQTITSFGICKPTAQLHRFRFMTVRGAKQRSGGEGKATKKSNTAFVSIEYVDSELWKLEPIIDILKKGGILIHLYLISVKIESCIYRCDLMSQKGFNRPTLNVCTVFSS
jgi:hypothetical protein